MKKKIAILSLIAIFIAATSISAQTSTAKTEKSKAKTEVKCDKKACCKDAKSVACCKSKKADVKKTVIKKK